MKRKLTAGIILGLIGIAASSWTLMYKGMDAPFNGVPDPKKIHRILGVEDSTVAAWYAGYSSSGDLLDIMGGGASKLLSDSGGPTITQSHLVGEDGNRLQAYSYNGSSQYHSVADAPWQDFHMTDFTCTFVFRVNATTTSHRFLSHSNASNDGIEIMLDATVSYKPRISFLGGSTIAAYANDAVAVDGRYHICHIRKVGNIASVWVDNVAGAPVDVSAGVAASSSVFVLGARSDGAARWWNGEILYTRINNVALSDAQIAKEVRLWQGAGVGTTWLGSSDVSRASTAYQTFPDGSMALRPVNTPRVGNGMLVEAAGTNLLTYTGAFSTNWSKIRTSIAATSVTLPDDSAGTTNTLHEDATAASTHYLNQTFSATSGTTYCASIYLKYNSSAGTPRPYVRLYFDDGTKYNVANINLQTGAWGTCISNFAVNGKGLRSQKNGWYRVWVYFTAENTATGNFTVNVCNADNGVSFDGQDQDSVFVAFPQHETGSYPTSYVPRLTADAAIRSADDVSVLPYRLRNTLADILTTQPTMAVDFTQDPSGSTITSGSYTFTKDGQPKHYDTAVYGDYHVFDGTNDSFKIANTDPLSADFIPAGSFSVVAVVTPDAIPGTYAYIFNKYRTSDNSRQWAVYLTSASSLLFSISNDGTTLHSVSKVAAAKVGETFLITGTYDYNNPVGTHTGKIYVNALSVATDATWGGPVVQSPTTQPMVGIARSDGGSRFQGKIHYLAYYDGTVLTQANHDAMYAALKLSGSLPTAIGSTSHYTKLRIKGEYKHIGLSDVGAVVTPIVDIAGNIGSADVDTNRVRIMMYNGLLYATIFPNGESTARYMSKSSVTHNAWNSFDATFDLSDLSASVGTVNGSAMTLDATMTGAKSVSFVDTKIRVGQQYDGTVNGNCQVRNVQVIPGL